jgi:hypothetical protein
MTTSADSRRAAVRRTAATLAVIAAVVYALFLWSAVAGR